jgi:hypothetical protein
LVSLEEAISCTNSNDIDVHLDEDGQNLSDRKASVTRKLFFILFAFGLLFVIKQNRRTKWQNTVGFELA